MRVVIAGGGTAGHVNPALAVAAELTQAEVSFIGTASGAESRLVPEAGHSLDTIEVRGFDRARPHTLPATALRALGAVRDSRRLLRARRPDVVVGMGGYVSLPVCIAARMMSIPVVLHEQNIVLGLANRVAKRFAAKVAVSFEATLEGLGTKGIHTGNPISPALARLDRTGMRAEARRKLDLHESRKTLLVFGGSLGAERLNKAALGLARGWVERDLQVLHICGPAHYEGLKSELDGGPAPDNYRLMAYVDPMSAAYAAADLALCRGGATTVAELCALGLPSVIVPYPFHRDRQQERHARVLESAGAAEVLEDAATSSESVAAIVEPLLEDAERLGSMSAAAARLGRPEAAAEVARVIVEVGS